VSRDRDWTAWCRYFLEALRSQAEANRAVVMAKAIIDLYARLKRETVEWSRSQYAVQALDWMFGRPIFKSTDFVANAGIPAPTAKRLLAAFRENGLFSVLVGGRGRRNAVYALKGAAERGRRQGGLRVNFRISDTFTASLARLTGEEQKAVKTTAFDLPSCSTRTTRRPSACSFARAATRRWPSTRYAGWTSRLACRPSS